MTLRIIGGLIGNRDPDAAATHSEAADSFTPVIFAMNEALGVDADEAFESEVGAYSALFEVMQDRMNRNTALVGSYFMEDSVLVSDLRVCVSLSEQLIGG